MWKTYYLAAGDNKHSAYVCLNAYLVVKNFHEDLYIFKLYFIKFKKMYILKIKPDI